MERTGLRPRPDAGQAAPLMVLAAVMTMGLILAAAEVGRVLDEAARARTAADAAALAGAAEGRAAAEEMAAANGAEMVAFERDGDRVTVAVRSGRVLRRARAEAFVTWPSLAPADSRAPSGDLVAADPG